MTDKPRFVGERKQTKLGELCKPKQWKSLKQSDMTEAGYPVYGANGIIGFYHEYNHPNETILVGCRGTCGEVSICRPESYVTSNAMCLDNLANCIDMGYLACFLKAYDFRKIIGGTSQPQITKTSISAIDVPVYPLDVQLAIRSKLEAVLNQVDCCRKTEEHLKSLVKSRFIEMFGGALSIENKWDSSILENCVESLESGKSPSCKNTSRKGSDPGVLKLSALSSGRFLSGENKAMLDGETIIQAKEVKQGDILLARKNTPQLVGSCVLVRENVKNLMIPDIVFRMHPNDSVNGEYLAALLSGPSYSNKVRGLAHGSNKSMSNIPKSELARLSIPLPPLSLQQQFAAFVASVDKSRFVVLNEKISRIQLINRRIAHRFSR